MIPTTPVHLVHHTMHHMHLRNTHLLLLPAPAAPQPGALHLPRFLVTQEP